MKIKEFNVVFKDGHVDRHTSGYLLVPYKSHNNEIKVITKITYDTYNELKLLTAALKKVKRKMKLLLPRVEVDSFHNYNDSEVVEKIEAIDALDNKSVYYSAVLLTIESNTEDSYCLTRFYRTNITKPEFSSVIYTIEKFIKDFNLKEKIAKRRVKARKDNN